MSEAGRAPPRSTRFESQSSSAAAQLLMLAALDAAHARASPAAAASLAWVRLG